MRKIEPWFVSHSATAGTTACGILKRAQTESDVRSLDELSPCNPSIGSRATYELTPLRMLQVMQQESACGTRQREST